MITLDDLQEVFRKVFDAPELVVTEGTTANDVDGWDSLSHANLILAVEQRFRVRLGTKQLLAMKTVGDLLTVVQKHLPES
jgi:acyl carrier protein